MTDKLAKIESGAIEARRDQPTVGQMLAGVIEKGITAENVGALKELIGLYKEMEKWDAEKAFNVAFVKLQSEIKSVTANKPVKNKDGTLRYHFAPFEDIMSEVQPHLERNGFTVSLSTDYGGPRLVKVCTLAHVSGHSRPTKFGVRIGGGPPGCTDTQADG